MMDLTVSEGILVTKLVAHSYTAPAAPDKFATVYFAAVFPLPEYLL